MRSVHLCAGVFALVFLAVYGVSALQMTHGKWVHMEARTVTREVRLPAGMTDARAASRELAVREGIAGELQGIRMTADGLGFRVLRPGTVWAAEYAASTGATRLRITDTGTLGALNRIHQMRGLWHTWAAYNIWVGLLGMVSFGVLVLGATGIYLWWVSHKDKRWTGALLGVSAAGWGGWAAWMRWGA